MKKTILITLLSLLTLGVFAQSQFNVYVVGNNINCPLSVTAYYSDSTTTDTLSLNSNPMGYFEGSFPATGNQFSTTICAEDCDTTICIYVNVVVGAVNTFTINMSADSDGDGWPDDIDCDPFNPTVNPQAPEICDGIDNNCDGILETTPYLNMYFVDDSLVQEENTIYLVNASTNCFNYSWTFGNGDSSNVAYPTSQYDSTGTFQICVTGYSQEGCVSDTCFNFTIVDSTTWMPGGMVMLTSWTLNVVQEFVMGVNNINTSNFQIWPNPVSNILNVNSNLNTGICKITSVDGRVIYSQNFSSNKFQVSTENLSSGTYILSLIGKNGNSTTTFIK